MSADLIAKLEAATKGIRELDADVARAAGMIVWSYDDNCHIDAQIENGNWEGRKRDHPDYVPRPRVTWRVTADRDKPGIDLPAYTTSLDAALTLVPEGWDYCLSMGSGEPANVAMSPANSIAEVHGSAPSAALALCIAALKARSA